MKKHEETFLLLALLNDQKRGKSHLRGLSSLLKNSLRVHELVARALRGECVRQIAKRKTVVLPFSTISSIPRVRTYHTRKPSRFVHALSARPLKVHGGRGSNVCADETIKINPISLCSHTDAYPNLNAPVSATPTHTLRVCVNSPQEKANKNHCPPICARRILRAAEFT